MNNPKNLIKRIENDIFIRKDACHVEFDETLNRIIVTLRKNGNTNYHLYVEGYRLFDEYGKELKNMTNFITHFATNSNPLVFYFEKEECTLIDGSKFEIQLRTTNERISETYTYILQNEKWHIL